MPQKANNHHINWRHLILGVILNILVIIAAFIIYHLTFNAPKSPYTITSPMVNQNLIDAIPDN